MTQDNGQGSTDYLNRLVNAISLLYFNTLKGLWFSEADQKQAVGDCFKTISTAFLRTPELSLTVHDHELLINNTLFHPQIEEEIAFVKHVVSLPINNICITPDMTLEDFDKIIDVLSASAEDIETLGGLPAILERFDIHGASVHNVTFTEVKPGEIVVSESERGAVEGGGKAPVNVTNILAFMKGDLSATPDVSKQVKDIARDPEQMAALLLQAASVQERSQPADTADTLGHIVVGCLRRSYGELKKDAALDTKTGRKAFKKTLLLLEKRILDRMHELAGDDAEAAAATVGTAIEQINGDLEAFDITTDYVKKMCALQQSEKTLRHALQRQGLAHVEHSLVKQNLMAGGMSPSGWRELLIKSGMADDVGIHKGDASSSLVDAIEHLDLVLEHMEKEFDTRSETDNKEEAFHLLAVLCEVNEKISKLTTHTSHDITTLQDDVAADWETVDKAELSDTYRATRRQLLQRLADIMTQIQEPLQLMEKSLEMVQSRTFGGVNEKQTAAIAIAFQNARLVDTMLGQIATLANAELRPQPAEDGPEP